VSQPTTPGGVLPEVVAWARQNCEYAGGVWSDSPLGCTNVPPSAALPDVIPVLSTSYRSWWLPTLVGALGGAILGGAVVYHRMTAEKPTP